MKLRIEPIIDDKDTPVVDWCVKDVEGNLYFSGCLNDCAYYVQAEIDANNE